MPGLEQREAPCGQADLAAGNVALGQAVGELVSENNLERRIAERPDGSQPGKPPDRFESDQPWDGESPGEEGSPQVPERVHRPACFGRQRRLTGVGPWLGTSCGTVPIYTTATLLVSYRTRALKSPRTNG